MRKETERETEKEKGRRKGKKSKRRQKNIEKRDRKKEKDKEPVAQRQDVVSGTLALLLHFHESAFKVSRAAYPKGTKSCRTQGESVHPSIHPSVSFWQVWALRGLGQTLGGPV